MAAAAAAAAEAAAAPGGEGKLAAAGDAAPAVVKEEEASTGVSSSSSSDSSSSSSDSEAEPAATDVAVKVELPLSSECPGVDVKAEAGIAVKIEAVEPSAQRSSSIARTAGEGLQAPKLGAQARQSTSSGGCAVAPALAQNSRQQARVSTSGDGGAGAPATDGLGAVKAEASEAQQRQVAQRSASRGGSGADVKVELSEGKARSRSRVRRQATADAGEPRRRSASVSSVSSSSSSGSSSGADSELSDLDGEEEVDFEPAAQASEHGIHKDLLTTSQLGPAPFDGAYRCDWSGAPAIGARGFNVFATRVLRSLVADASATAAAAAPAAPRACPPLQPHQAVVSALLHPRSPTTRLLVDHPTGSGKTREMISALDNFFFDPRPKVPIFPKEPVCRNFYAELLRWPNRYRDFFGCLRARDASLAAGAKDWRTRRGEVWLCNGLEECEIRELCDSLREVLEMKGWFFLGCMRRSRREAFQRRFPGEPLPAAPLRALRYTSAGGRHTELGPSGLPASALLKVAFDHQGKNVYSNKIVIMDEVHNLVRTQTQYGLQLERLRELLHGARGLVLAGFTGTPILSEPWEGRQLLDIIKGSTAGRGDEGYLSCFPFRPPALFPKSLPRGIPDAILTPNLRRRVVRHFVLSGEVLQRYDAKRQKGANSRRLCAYCGLSVHFGSLHNGKNGSRARILANMASCAPKLDLVAKEVAARPEKALVLINRSSGLEALLEHLQALGRISTPPFEVATMGELAAFNAAENLRGERFRVLVADATTCSEGVNFLAVRRVLLVDVPGTPSAFVQSVGRAIRMYGHRGLPDEERTVTTSLFVAKMPRWLRSPLGALVFRAQRRHGDPEEAASKARQLLRRLLGVGVKDLETLKARLDAYGASRAPAAAAAAAAAESAGGAQKAPMAATDVAGFLEHLGLWDEASALKDQAKAAAARAGKPRKRQRKAAPAFPARHPAGAVLRTPPKMAKPELDANGTKLEVKAEVKTETKVELAEMDENMSLRSFANASKRFKSLVAEKPSTSTPASTPKRRALATAAKLEAKQEPVKREGAKLEPKEELTKVEADDADGAKPPELGEVLRAWARQHLSGVLQALYLAPSVDEAVAELNLSPWTADEEALRSLARRSRELVPALAKLRAKAVDGGVLRQLCVKEEPDDAEAGESSALEFGVSDQSDGEARKAGGKQKEIPLVLPPGWRTDKFRRGRRECREFIDPNGRRYRCMAEARRAVDAFRARENMAERMREKYAGRIASSVG
eukprot:TRINITY_DN4874_c1_g2_i2.p1 TRINITY_DN4874_c1_g2~~TRINITY_DN4874_c1_g2_i2.p1  ORF type:complete len:1277 (-),score=329.72 TRINITY_DN4874_c1_g2_i2:127-3894(-)